MMGTLAGVLARMEIPTPADRYWADVQGDIEEVGGILKITHIRVSYHLTVPKGKQEAANQALSSYITRCPAAQSVIGCINIEDRCQVEELP